MNKSFKYILITFFVLSLMLNVYTLYIIKNYQTNLNNIEARVGRKIDMLYATTSSIAAATCNRNQGANTQPQNDIMTPSQFADYLHVDISDVYKRIIENPHSKVPYIKLGNEVRFNKQVITEYLSKGNSILE